LPLQPILKNCINIMQKKTTLWLAFMAFMLTGNVALAQRVLTGKVSDGLQPIAGASVTVLGTQTGTSSDANGLFSVSTDQPEGQLEIRYMGFLPKLVNFTTQSELGSIVLEVNSKIGRASCREREWISVVG